MASTSADVPKLIGARVKRREDPRLITGHAQYVDDLQPARCVHMAVRRSEYAHARIVRIDTEAAKAMPGVLGVYTAEDVSEIPSLPAAPATPDTRLAPRPVLASGKVRYVGEPIA
ncbi:MAG TPA: hypothetical protein VFA70_06675, partial [Dehalococcoidia bacterium]|nr:hypothetical protein [Dehalococcoidia bacterium]